MEFEISDQIINRAIMGYMRRQRMFDTLLMMHMECNLTELEYGSDLKFLHGLIVRGSWDDVLTYISPLKDHVAQYNQILFIVKRQQYLEALCWQGAEEADGLVRIAPWRPIRHASQLTSSERELEVDMELVVTTLKSLETLCSRSEFNKLCNCLTYSSLTESPDFSDWSVSKGRLECFSAVEALVHGSHHSPLPTRGLEDLLALALESCAATALRGKAPPRFPVHAAMDSNGSVFPDLPNGRTESVPALTISSSAPHGGAYFHHGRYDTVGKPPLSPHANQRVQRADEAYYEGGKRLYSSDRHDHSHHDSHHQQISRPPQSRDSMGGNESFKGGDRHVDVPHRLDRRTGPPDTDTAHGVNYHACPPSVREPRQEPVAWTVGVDDASGGKDAYPGPPVGQPADVKRGRGGGEEGRDAGGAQSVRRKKWNILGEDDGSGTERAPCREQGGSQGRIPAHPDNRSPEDTRQMSRGQGHGRSGDDGTVFSPSSLATGVGTAPKPLTNVLSSRRSSQERSKPPAATSSSLSRGGYLPMPWSAVPAGIDVDVQPVCIHRDSTPLRCIAVCSPSECLDDSLADTHSAGQESGGVEANLSLAIGSNTKNLCVLSMTRPSNSVRILTDMKDVHRGSVYTCDWARDGSILASGSNDKMIKIARSSRDGGYTLSSTLKAHTGTIRSVKFNPFEGGDCNSLVSGGAGDCRLRLWDVQQGSCMELAAHHDHIHGISWMSPQLILSGCESGQLIAHDTRAASVAWSIDMSGGVCALHCLADDGVGIVGHVEGGVSVLDLRERRVLATYRLHGGDVRSVAMWNESGYQKQKQATFGGTDGFFALTTSFDGKGCVWRLPSQLASGNVVGPPTEFRKVMSLIGHTDKILCGVHSPLTDDIFTSGADGNVMFWSPRQYHV